MRCGFKIKINKDVGPDFGHLSRHHLFHSECLRLVHNTRTELNWSSRTGVQFTCCKQAFRWPFHLSYVLYIIRDSFSAADAAAVVVDMSIYNVSPQSVEMHSNASLSWAVLTGRQGHGPSLRCLPTVAPTRYNNDNVIRTLSWLFFSGQSELINLTESCYLHCIKYSYKCLLRNK